MRPTPIFICCALTLAGAGCKKSAPAGGAQLPFSDDFERKELGPNWFPSGGHWEIRDGQVYTSGANNAPLFLALDLPDDLVLEVDIKSDTPTVDAKIELMTDGRAHQSGYIFILGGWGNQISTIARLDEHGKDRVERRPTGATGQRWYRWRIEKKGGQIRWLLDGQPYISFQDPAPLHGPGHNRLAFSNWQNQLRYDNLKVWAYDQAPPVKTSTAGAAP
jgi:hypothetical protein